MKGRGAILLAMALCGARAIPAYAEAPMVTGLLPVVVTDELRPGDKGFRFERYFRVADAEAAS